MKATLAFELASAQRSRDSVNLGVDVGTSWTGSARRVWKLHSGYAANLSKDFTAQAYYATLGVNW